MFGDESVSHTGTIDLTKANEDAPFFTLRNYDSGESIFSIKGRNGAVIGDIRLDGGNLIFQPAPEDPGEDPAPQPRRPAASGGGGLPGQVVSGSGASYIIDTFPNGLSSAAVRVNATQAGIDPAATIPVGTWGPVVRAGAQYVMLFPLWG